jgi:uncharacterized membrane protein required for colicin V production
MIASVVQSFSMSNVPFNAFDVVVVGMLGFGLFRGRKNGMSKEMIPMLKWVVLVLVSGSYYQTVAQIFMNAAGMGKLTSYILGYLILAALVYLIFSLIKNATAKKLETSNLFGNGEFYVGMPAGLIRFACILLACLALLNARHYSAVEIQVKNNYQQTWFGTDLFPDLPTLQKLVFEKSFTGPAIKKYLGSLFINTATPGGDKKPQPKITVGH